MAFCLEEQPNAKGGDAALVGQSYSFLVREPCSRRFGKGAHSEFSEHRAAGQASGCAEGQPFDAVHGMPGLLRAANWCTRENEITRTNRKTSNHPGLGAPEDQQVPSIS